VLENKFEEFRENFWADYKDWKMINKK
jgi:hypothetical protein